MDKKIKIGFIVEHYPPTQGGVATSAQRVARGLADQGIDVHVVCFDTNGPLESEDYIIDRLDDGVKVSSIGPFFLKQKSINVDSLPEKIKATLRRRAFNQMVSIFRNENIDCIISFYILNAGYLSQFVSREFQIPHIACVRGNDIGRNIFNVERFGVIQWVINGADKIVCVNEHLKKRLLLAFPDAEYKTSIISNSVHPLQSTPNKIYYRKRLLEITKWRENDLILVFAGTLREKKGVVPLLRALDICDNPSVRLLVIGPDIGSLEAKICGNLWNNLKAKNYIYTTGFVHRKEVNNWLIAGDVVVVPSLDDGMANCLLEGMNIGLCPLVTEIFSDVIQNNINGLVVPCNDSKNLAIAINRLFQNKDIVIQFGQTGRNYINEKHKPKEETQKYINLIHSVLS
jgi:glycosyltransferase involved in cell wall biosynthesis